MASPEPRRQARSLALGKAGEDRVAAHYESAGFRVVERNWRCPLGEIDLIVRKGRLLVLCEVKTRTSDRFGGALEAVNGRKQRRLRQLGALYTAQATRTGRAPRSPADLVVRFDVAAVSPSGEVLVVEDAFA